MKLYIARDNNNELYLYASKPIRGKDGIFYMNETDHADIIKLDNNKYSTITFENSPKEVELTLCNQIDTVKIQDHNPKKQACVLTNHGIDTDVVFK